MWTACKEAEPTRVYTSSGKEIMVLKCCWHSAERFTNVGKLLVLVKTFFHGLLFYWHSAEQFTNEGKLIVLARNFPPRIICNCHLVKQFTNEGNFIVLVTNYETIESIWKWQDADWNRFWTLLKTADINIPHIIYQNGRNQIPSKYYKMIYRAMKQTIPRSQPKVITHGGHPNCSNGGKR